MKVVKSVAIDEEIISKIETLEEREYYKFNFSALVNTLLEKWVRDNLPVDEATMRTKETE